MGLCANTELAHGGWLGRVDLCRMSCHVGGYGHARGYDCAQGYGRAQGYSHAQWRGDSLGDRLHVEIITVYGTLSDSVQCYKHYSCGKQLKRLSKRLSECS